MPTMQDVGVFIIYTATVTIPTAFVGGLVYLLWLRWPKKPSL
jgi:hypothetical protein